ncbi:hypothetical protein HY993_05170 [Candidatus Micrarchaeota archaeon]|nr:hypothetical protein [Candidatus Micrarchaeota archaeon]
MRYYEWQRRTVAPDQAKGIVLGRMRALESLRKQSENPQTQRKISAEWASLINFSKKHGLKWLDLLEELETGTRPAKKGKPVLENPDADKTALGEARKQKNNLLVKAIRRGFNWGETAREAGLETRGAGRAASLVYPWKIEYASKKDMEDAILDRLLEVEGITNNHILPLAEIKKAKSEQGNLRKFAWANGSDISILRKEAGHKTNYDENGTVEAKDIIENYPHFAHPDAVEIQLARIKQLEQIYARLKRLQKNNDLTIKQKTEESMKIIKGANLARLVADKIGPNAFRPGIKLITRNAYLNALQAPYHLAKILRLQEICRQHGLTPLQARANVEERRRLGYYSRFKKT